MGEVYVGWGYWLGWGYVYSSKQKQPCSDQFLTPVPLINFANESSDMTIQILS